VIRQFQTVIDECEGAPSVVADNKGVQLVAIFGAPPRAHEDDPARAIAAVQQFGDELAADGIACSAGVATGRAMYGIAGTADRRTMTTAGEVINVASRLCATAQGTVLCDQETAAAAHARYTFTVLNPIIVKGKAQQVSVFTPVGDVVIRRRHTADMRGRDEELERLRDLLAPPTTRRLDLAIVVGDGGLGKSTLLEAIGQEAAADSRRIVIAHADAIDRTTPFRAWAPVVADLVGVRGSVGELSRAELAERLVGVLGHDRERDAELLAAVFARAVRHGSSAALGDEEPTTVIPNLVVELLATAGSRALVVVEDAHWADDASLQVLHRLVAHPSAPAVLVSTRPEGLAALAQLAATPRAEVIELGPLGDDAVFRIIADRLGTDLVPQELLDFVEPRVAGHPFFCEQLLKSLVESGTVLVSGSKVTVGELDRAALPSTVEGVIVSRLDRLDAESQQCLKAAAVAGSRFDVAGVQACLPMVDVEAVLRAMGPDGLLRPVDEAGRFEFQHVIARDVVYGLMTEQQRRQLHRILAGHLERRAEGAAGGANGATIGRHWREAGEASMSLGYFEQVAGEAFRSGSFAATVAMLDEIDRTADDADLALGPVQQARLLVLRARASYYLGLYTGARDELNTVIALLDDPMPVTDDEHAAERERLEALRASSASWPTPSESDHILFDAYRTAVKVNYLLGAPGPFLATVSLRGLILADRMGDWQEAATMQVLVAGAYVTLGDRVRFEHHQREAVEVAEGPDGERVANHVWRMLAVARAGLGDFDGSLDASDKALAALDPEGQNRDSGIWQTRAAVLLCQGRFAEAPTAWQRTADIARRDGNHRLLRWSRLDEAQTLVGQDRIAEADEVLTSTTIELGPPTDPLGTIEHHYTTAIVRSAQGRYTDAVREARQVVRMVEAVPPSGFHWVEFCSGAVEAMVAALLDPRDPPAIPRATLAPEVDHVIGVLERVGRTFVHVLPRVPLARALYHVAHDDPDAAATSLGAAHLDAIRRGATFDAARSVVMWWRFDLPGDRPPLAPAVDALRHLGALRWVHRGEALLRAHEPSPTD
jgi:tetratricopeptide (TPR) repeat protein